MTNTKLFLLLGTSLSFLPQTIFAAECAVTDCSLLGYTDSPCPESGLKCPFGEGWYCGGGAAEDCLKLGYNKDCIGTGYAGGSGESCNGKYQSCTCASGYTWNGSSCIVACNYSYTAEYCARSCKSTSGSPCYKGGIAYYPSCGSSTCSGKCVSGTCYKSYGSGACCNSNCDNYDRCMEVIKFSCEYEKNFCESYFKGYFKQDYSCKISHPNPDWHNTDYYKCYVK